MRTTILAGKIGPAFRTRTEDTDGLIAISTLYGSTITQHYYTDTSWITLPEIRTRALNLMFSYASQDMGVEEFDSLGKWLRDITEVEA